MLPVPLDSTHRSKDPSLIKGVFFKGFSPSHNKRSLVFAQQLREPNVQIFRKGVKILTFVTWKCGPIVVCVAEALPVVVSDTQREQQRVCERERSVLYAKMCFNKRENSEAFLRCSPKMLTGHCVRECVCIMLNLNNVTRLRRNPSVWVDRCSCAVSLNQSPHVVRGPDRFENRRSSVSRCVFVCVSKEHAVQVDYMAGSMRYANERVIMARLSWIRISDRIVP